MASLSVDNFIDYVERSQLVTEEALRSSLMQLRQQHGGKLPDDADLVALAGVIFREIPHVTEDPADRRPEAMDDAQRSLVGHRDQNRRSRT